MDEGFVKRWRRKKAWIYRAFRAPAFFATIWACGGPPAESRPVASLSASAAATVAFARIQKKWDAADGSTPGTLRPSLERFITQFPNDGRVPLARAYLVFEMMDLGDWAGAEKALALLRDVGPGTTGDVVTTGEARMLRHEGQPDAALDKLRPLVGKIVDATIRELFLEEITRDALETRRDFEAIAYMDAWLRGIGEDKKDRVHEKVVLELAKIPEQVLEQTYRAIRANRSVLGYGADIQRFIAERLAETAIARGDPNLARWLLDGDAGPAFVGGDAGIALGEIATSKRGLVSAAGRTIGLLLPTASVDQRDEAADVTRGVAWALELPREDPKSGDGVRLVTRDDGGNPARTEIALDELAGEGATVIIAAVDPKSAERALSWAEAHAMPLLALAAPDAASQAKWGFVVGPSRDEELAALADELAKRRVAKAAVVGSAATPILEGRGFPLFLPFVSCDIETRTAGEPRFPVADWDRQGAKAVVVAGPVECARDVIRELATLKKPVTVALTLDDGSTTARANGVSLVAVSVGVVPVVALRPNDVHDPDVRAYMIRFGARPSYWTALGRDAGALARKASSALPLDTATAPAEIAARRAIVQSRIGSITARLWTRDADGFGGEHALPRTLQVLDISKP